MTAYLTVAFTPKDPDKLQDYSKAAAASLKAFSGEALARGPIETLSGDSGFEMMVIFAFPTKQDAQAWYRSDAYQGLIALRDQAMNASFQLIG